MKRFSLGLAAVGLTASLGAYAALPTSAAPFQVNIPNFAPGWEFNLTALYLRPSNNDEDYTIVTNTSPLTEFTYNVKAVDPGFDWAIGVGLGYIFPDSGNDIRAAWIHFFEHNNTSSVLVDEDGAEHVGPTFDTDFDTAFDDASGTEEFKYDAVDLDVGQFINLGTRLQLRLFGGLRFAHIERDFDTVQEELSSFDDTFLDTDNNSTFSGIGPLFGVDSEFHLGHCVGLVAHFDTALLVGDVKSSDTFTAPHISSSLTLIDTTTSTTSDDLTRIVPGFDAKLGLDWSIPFDCDSWFTVELGYQVTEYIDVFDRHEPDEVAQSTNSVVNFDSTQRVTSNFSFDGPYLSFNLKV
jgi:hypothetical protein